MSITVRQRNPRSLQRAFRAMVEKTKKEVAVGFPAGKANAYPDGTEVAYVAAIQVYGLGVPKRDFMTLAKPEIVETTAPLIQRAIKADNKDKEVIFGAVGEEAKKAIENAIIRLNSPPNSPVTIARKGTGKSPLIDTHHMVESVNYVVRDRTR